MQPLETTRHEIASLLVQTGKDHHRAYEATDGEDPEWPIWYAEHLQQPLGKVLGIDLTRSRLVYCLMDAEYERAARAEDSEWAPYYAEHLVERLAPATTPTKDRLVLYQFETCGFCARVRAAIERLGLEVEMRDIHDGTAFRDELVAVRGRATVPVLKIESPDGTERWMPESADIIRYLEETYGDRDSP